MRPGMIRAWLAGASILIVVVAVWSLVLRLQIFSNMLLALLWASPGVAAFVTSSLSPTRKVPLGSSMALVAAMLATGVNWMFQTRGVGVDFPGLRGSLILFTTVLAGAAVLSILGSIAGLLATRNRRH